MIHTDIVSIKSSSGNPEKWNHFSFRKTIPNSFLISSFSSFSFRYIPAVKTLGPWNKPSALLTLINGTTNEWSRISSKPSSGTQFSFLFLDLSTWWSGLVRETGWLIFSHWSLKRPTREVGYYRHSLLEPNFPSLLSRFAYVDERSVSVGTSNVSLVRRCWKQRMTDNKRSLVCQSRTMVVVRGFWLVFLQSMDFNKGMCGNVLMLCSSGRKNSRMMRGACNSTLSHGHRGA